MQLIEKVCNARFINEFQKYRQKYIIRKSSKNRLSVSLRTKLKATGFTEKNNSKKKKTIIHHHLKKKENQMVKYPFPQMRINTKPKVEGKVNLNSIMDREENGSTSHINTGYY